jgi:hypothetical protein
MQLIMDIIHTSNIKPISLFKTSHFDTAEFWRNCRVSDDVISSSVLTVSCCNCWYCSSVSMNTVDRRSCTAFTIKGAREPSAWVC